MNKEELLLEVNEEQKWLEEAGYTAHNVDIALKSICFNIRLLEQERKTGQWFGYNADKEEWQRSDGSPVFMSCSECHGTVLNNGSAHWHYCPNCGAKMLKKKGA